MSRYFSTWFVTAYRIFRVDCRNLAELVLTMYDLFTMYLLCMICPKLEEQNN